MKSSLPPSPHSPSRCRQRHLKPISNSRSRWGLDTGRAGEIRYKDKENDEEGGVQKDLSFWVINRREEQGAGQRAEDMARSGRQQKITTGCESAGGVGCRSPES